MQLSEKFYDNFDNADIQFCTGITLSNMGHNKVATQIIEYKTNKSFNIRSAALSSPELKQKLADARAEIDEAIDKLAVAENLNHDFAAVKWFCTEPILRVSKRNRTHNDYKQVSVAELLCMTDFDSVYESVIKMLITTRSNHLIAHYISTTLFEQPFRKALTIAINSRLRNNAILRRLSDSDFDILRDDFEHIYRKNLTMSSNPFFSITGDPNSALCGDPIKLWYINDPKSKFQSVVFGHGQDVETEEGSVSRLNLKETENEININDIDFVGTCTKIYTASSVLFMHKDLLVYDIFSHHCDRQLRGKSDDFKKQCANLYTGITFDVAAQSIDGCLNETHYGKIIDRRKYADYLDSRFSHSVKIQDLREMCERLREITRSVKIADGHRLFEVDGHVVYQDTTESQRFEMLFSGYKAMYKLIDYINRNESRTGVSVNDFPITIFRDPAYLKRFQTFDDYIAGHDIVKQLIDDVTYSDDSSRRNEKFNGIFNNETVGEILASKNSIKYVKEFSILGEKNVSFMYDIIHKKAKAGEDECMADLIVDMVSNLTDIFGDFYHFIPSKHFNAERTLDTLSYVECLALIQQIAQNNANYLKEQEQQPEWHVSRPAYSSAILFFYVLERVQQIEKHPVADSDGFFVFTLDGMREGVVQKVEANKAEIDRKSGQPDVNAAELQRLNTECAYLKNTVIYRLVNFLMFYDMLFGHTYLMKDSSVITTDTVHSMYYAYSVIKKYLDSSYEIMFKLRKYAYSNPEDITRPARQKKLMTENMFRIAIELAGSMDIMSIPGHITSELDLGCLCTSDLVLYMDRDLLDVSKEASAKNNKRKADMVSAFNRMLKTFDNVTDFFSGIRDSVKYKLSATSKESAFGMSDLLSKFELLNREILCDSFINNDECQLAAQIISAHATQFNEYGFMLKNGDLVFLDFGLYKRYFHKKGVVCNIYNDINCIEHTELSETDKEYILAI